MDEDWANHFLDQVEAGEEVIPQADPDRVDPLHFTPQLAYLSLIADRVLAVRSAIFAVNSEESERPVPTLPRPTSAVDRVREKRAMAELLELERQLFGGGIDVNM